MKSRRSAGSSPRLVAAWLVVLAAVLWFVSPGCGVREAPDRGGGGAAARSPPEAQGYAGTAGSETSGEPARRVIAEIGAQFQRRIAPAAGVRRTSPAAAEKAPFFGTPWKASFEPDGDGALSAIAEDEAPAAIEGMSPWRQAPRGRLGSRFPAGADGEVEVTALASNMEEPSVWVRERLAGALSAARAAVVDGRMVYAAAKPGIDRIYEITAQRVEEYVRIADAGAAEGLTYEVETGPGIADLVVDGSGYGLLATDASGKAVLKAPQPYGVDARGEGVQGRLVVARTSGQRFSVKVALVTDGAQVSFPVLLDPGWVSTGSMGTARANHTATLLNSGKVLVAGGISPLMLSSAELYDPTAGTWSATGSMANLRQLHTATLLPSGKVLVAGGYDGGYLSGAELYDPTAGTWSSTGSMVTERANHTATLLQGGKILVAGGNDVFNFPLSGAELYDPTAGTWSSTGSMATERISHTATLLQSGGVLVAGGGIENSPLSSVELYDPTAGTWSATGSMVDARQDHTATLLQDGQVLVAGGADSSDPLSSAELYDPTAGTWSATGSLATARVYHTATLQNGQVLVAGGIGSPVLSSTELYDPTAGTWSSAGSMVTARLYHTATLLQGGDILVAAGYSGTMELASADLYGCTPLTICPSPDNCGTIPDGCGDTVTCGTCTAPETCGGGGTANVCGCTPIKSCPDDTCGTISNGCGGAFDCGNCNGNGTCSASTCACNTGFAGATCDVCAAGYHGYPSCTSCDPSTTCGGHGTCSSAGSCTCNPGHAGPACQYSDATTCSGHGTALADGSCTCNAGYTGAVCENSPAHAGGCHCDLAGDTRGSTLPLASLVALGMITASRKRSVPRSRDRRPS